MSTHLFSYYRNNDRNSSLLAAAADLNGAPRVHHQVDIEAESVRTYICRNGDVCMGMAKSTACLEGKAAITGRWLRGGRGKCTSHEKGEEKCVWLVTCHKCRGK